MRTRITLACTECKERNYATSKNKKTQTERIEINKFCSSEYSEYKKLKKANTIRNRQLIKWYEQKGD